MPRPTATFDNSPVTLSGWPAEIAEQIRRDEEHAAMSQEPRAMDLAEFKAGVADVQVAYKDRTFSVGYRPESVTDEDLALLEGFSDKAGVELLKATVAPLTRLLVRWSLTLGAEPLVISEQGVTFLPPRMRVAILQAIMADFFDSGNAKPSDATSQEGDASEGTARPMPASSGTPNGQALPPGTSPVGLTRAAP